MDALAALCGFVSREWGCYGYRPVSMVGGIGVLYLEVGCSDGSRFWVGTDRHAVHLVSGDSLEACVRALHPALEAEKAQAIADERATYFAYTDAVVAVHGARYTIRQARQRRFDSLRDAWRVAYTAAYGADPLA